MIAKLAPAVIIGALLSFPVAGYAQDTAKQMVKDTAITTKIKAAQAKDPMVSALRIDVETDNSGKVVLSGNAKSQAEIDRAVQIAKGVEGVTSVQNNMTVGGAAAGTAATRSDTAATARTGTTPGTSAGTTPGTRAGATTGTSAGTTTGTGADATISRAPRQDRN